MFGWLFKNREKENGDEIRESFSAVKKDMDVVGKWIKHLDGADKQLFSILNSIKSDLSNIKNEIGIIREEVDAMKEGHNHQQVFENLPVLGKQTGDEDVYTAVQTPVQTGNFYEIFKGLTPHERALIFTLMNSDLKLSYEDLALLMGKEKSTVRGQINAIKQKSEGLIEEITEKNGKKRVFVPLEIKEKLSKYAKVRVGKKKKVRVNAVSEENLS
ncbi:hypothetical protein FJZ18_01770 [Candidatus Pacearchaeota archaeon]|nr:hypothetical protein [Candidatus Pacearchaeota archaeon]